MHQLVVIPKLHVRLDGLDETLFQLLPAQNVGVALTEVQSFHLLEPSAVVVDNPEIVKNERLAKKVLRKNVAKIFLEDAAAAFLVKKGAEVHKPARKSFKVDLRRNPPEGERGIDLRPIRGSELMPDSFIVEQYYYCTGVPEYFLELADEKEYTTIYANALENEVAILGKVPDSVLVCMINYVLGNFNNNSETSNL